MEDNHSIYVQSVEKRKAENLKKKEKLISGLTDLFSNNDKEKRHIKADHLLLEFINDKEVIRLFNQLPKWYA